MIIGQSVMPDPEPPLRPHVRCLRPGCEWEALMEPGPRLGAGEAVPAAGLLRRFVCRYRARGASVSWLRGRPRPDNPCGWVYPGRHGTPAPKRLYP